MASRYWTRKFIPPSDSQPNKHPLPFNNHITIPKGTDRNDPDATCFKVEVTTHTIREIHHFCNPYTLRQAQRTLRSRNAAPVHKIQSYLVMLTARVNPSHYVGHAADYVCFMNLQFAKDRYREAREELILAEQHVAGRKERSLQASDDHEAQVLERARVRHDFFLVRLASVRLVVQCINVEIRFAQVRETLQLRAQMKRKRSE